MGRKRKNPKHKQKSPRWYQKENDWGDFVFDWSLGLGGETWREIIAIVILIIALVIVLGYFGAAGQFGASVVKLSHTIFGGFPSYIFPLVLFWFGILLLFPNRKKQRLSRFIGFLIFIIFISAFAHLFIAEDEARQAAINGMGGGTLGYMISNPLRSSIGLFVAFLATVTMVMVSLMMIFNFSFQKYFGGNQKEDEDEEEKGKYGVNQSNKVSVFRVIAGKIGGLYHPKKLEREAKATVISIEPRSQKDNSAWEYPPLTLLNESDDEANPGNIQKNFDTIKKTLLNFHIEILPGEANVGPRLTQYTFKPKEGVKLNQITARANDLALALASKSLRIEAPIPGKSSVGIEHPNTIPATVTLREVITSNQFKAERSKLAVALGRDVAGVPYAIDLEKMPHLMIAGATGSGKSVCINTLITTFLFNNSPDDLRFIMVDPKRVELVNYNGIPHLLTPVIIDVDKTVSALKWAIWEMERRYKVFSALGKRNIQAYNMAPGEEGKLPYIVIIIDELADLMATAANDVEGSIVRLAQMARATGVHLVVATQRPSVDVLTGLIKANITARIAFATASQVDSRTILDMSGAEKLLGNGDMLFIGNGLSRPKRIQGCFVSDKEIEELVKFITNQSETDYNDAVLQFKGSIKGVRGRVVGGDADVDDDMYEDAVRVVSEAGKASASLLQRRLRIGYARAARLLDMLEENGSIGPADGAKPRDVLIANSSDPFAPNGVEISNIDYHSRNREDER